jgi:hypothetical protein
MGLRYQGQQISAMSEWLVLELSWSSNRNLAKFYAKVRISVLNKLHEAAGAS